MSKKSIWQQIVKPRETYIDGYGQQREVYEPQWISTARNLYNKGKDVYNKIDRRINPGKYIELTDPETGEMYKPTLNSGIGLMADLFDPSGAIGKIDDIINLANHTASFKDKVSILSYYGKNRDKVRRKGFALKNYTKDLFGKPLIGVGQEAYVIVDPKDQSRVLKFIKRDFLKDNLHLYDFPIYSRKDVREYFKFYASKRNNIPHQQPLSLEGYWYRDGQIMPVVSQKRMKQGDQKINFDDVTKKDNIMIDENGIPWGIDLFTLKMGGVLKSHQNAKIPLYLQYFNYNK